MDANGKMIVEDPVHPPTMHELMTHTAGFSYGLFGDGPVDKLYQSQGVMAVEIPSGNDRQARQPFRSSTSRALSWVYSVSMDVQGYIVEKLSGQSLPDFMHDHIFAPLDMKDSGFFVPKDKVESLRHTVR